METLQMLKYGLKKAQLDFTGMWVIEEEELEQQVRTLWSVKIKDWTD